MTKYDLTLTKAESQTEERYRQILKRYLEYFSSYKHFSKLKHRTRTWVQMTKYDMTLT